jgi:hypothetical protein
LTVESLRRTNSGLGSRGKPNHTKGSTQNLNLPPMVEPVTEPSTMQRPSSHVPHEIVANKAFRLANFGDLKRHSDSGRLNRVSHRRIPSGGVSAPGFGTVGR